MRKNFGAVQTVEYAYKDFFTYQVNFLGVAPGVSLNQQIGIQADSDFIWSKACFLAYDSTAGIVDVAPQITVLVTDSGSGRQLSNAAIPLGSTFGSGELPFVLPRPRIFRAQTTVTIQVTNIHASDDYDMYLSFIGEKGFWN